MKIKIPFAEQDLAKPCSPHLSCEIAANNGNIAIKKRKNISKNGAEYSKHADGPVTEN